MDKSGQIGLFQKVITTFFVLGSYEYIKRLAKLERTYSFMLKYSKITVWASFFCDM